MASSDIDNLNRMCSTDLTSEVIIKKMFLISILHSVIFGMIYGLYWLPLSNDKLAYFTGKWRYRTYPTMILHLLAMVIITGIVPLIFVIIFPLFLK
jgi:hypothetical protein